MKTSFGSGLDEISSFFIIARSLAYLFNFSLQSGIFPDSWKTARVAPIYREGSKEERSNYRPISKEERSNLRQVSKCMELLVDSFAQIFNMVSEA